MLIIKIQNLGDATIFRFSGRLTFGTEDGVLSWFQGGPAFELWCSTLAEITAIDAAGLAEAAPFLRCDWNPSER